MAENNISSLEEGDELKCPSYRKGGVRYGEKKGVFSKYSWPRLWAGPCCKQMLSWSVGTLDAQAPVRKAGRSGVLKALMVRNPVPEMQCTCGQTESIYAGSICWLVQALLNYPSVAPWLLDTPQELSKSQLLVQNKVWTCQLERGPGKKEDVSGCSFTQRSWIWHSSGSSVASPGQEPWAAQATLCLERYLHHNQKQSQGWLYICFPKQLCSLVFTTSNHNSRGME